MKTMEVKIKTRASNYPEAEEIIKKIKQVEKEYSCNCTLLEIEID